MTYISTIEVYLEFKQLSLFMFKLVDVIDYFVVLCVDEVLVERVMV